MRMLGLTSIVLAAGLALAGPSQAQAPAAAPAAPAAAPVAAPAPATATATPAAPAASAEEAKPADPLQNADGSFKFAPDPSIGQPSTYWGLQQQVTPNGRTAHWFHDVILLPLIVFISIFVLVLLLWVIVRYRRAANPEPSKTSHNTLIEVIWTLVPVLILVAVAVPSIRLLAAQFKPAPDNAVTLKAIGNQWFWSYEYPDHGGIQITANMLKEKNEVEPGQRFRTDQDGPRLLATDNRIVLPVGVPIRLQTTAQDVIHAWAVPAFWIKLDAIPGRTNETSFIIEKPGIYFGQCSELCGARHGYMPIVVEAVSPEVFEQWVKAKGGKMPEAKAAAAPAATAPAAPANDSEPANAADALAQTNNAEPANAAASTGH
ncbi:cytochrome c oxidase subunit II [Sphingomonas canadensis]|uniref:Cytochrome c oxidase subunit 2 n=1 Tax=Sphingomonas canadensis TaxID=1219257 RepID=A0ABW3H7V3_9SPHN|nr:cytochrome c oxidase subunit II [Sphingomonas canadensis]MCW3837207.1 cytochrome c oxidase subunit II [Sphingomonas canadensis]